MEARLTLTALANGGSIQEVDNRTDLDRLILAAVGSPQNGRLLEITINVKTSAQKPYTECTALGYFSSNQCRRLLAPGETCPEAHYHRPQWEDDGESAPFCKTCQSLGITDNPAYNHSNAGG
jgi:hypothetical protein